MPQTPGILFAMRRFAILGIVCLAIAFGLVWQGEGSMAVPITQQVDGNGWADAGDPPLQFEIDGTPLEATPEPAALFVPLIAMVGVVITARRNKRVAKVFDASE
jgi:hypothetical protein